jgi:Family of unknown function (DUF6510)
MDDRMLDGNAIAGLLGEVFARDMTTAIGTCGQCGESGAIGSAHAYQGASVVLRCSHCDHVLVKIVRDDTRIWIGFPGVQTLEVAVRGT